MFRRKTFVTKWKRPGMLFWRRMWFTKEDFVGVRLGSNGRPHQGAELKMFLTNKFGGTMEIPYNGTMFRFSRSRLDIKREQMDQEAGQSVK